MQLAEKKLKKKKKKKRAKEPIIQTFEKEKSMKLCKLMRNYDKDVTYKLGQLCHLRVTVVFFF